jgi:hypothetical protein
VGRLQAGPELYEKEIPDSELGRLLLKQVEKLLPKPGDLESVEIAGRDLKTRHAAVLRRKSKGRISRNIRLLAGKNGDSGKKSASRKRVTTHELLSQQSYQGQRPLMDLLAEIPDRVFFSDTGNPDFQCYLCRSGAPRLRIE